MWTIYCPLITSSKRNRRKRTSADLPVAHRLLYFAHYFQWIEGERWLISKDPCRRASVGRGWRMWLEREVTSLSNRLAGLRHDVVLVRSLWELFHLRGDKNDWRAVSELLGASGKWRIKKMSKKLKWLKMVLT